MTKLKSLFSITLSAILFCLLTSCSGGYNSKRAEELVDKYQDKGKFTKSEYAEAVDMCNYVCDDMLKAFKGLKSKVKGKSYEEFNSLLQDTENSMEDKYEYFPELMNIVMHASESEMGAKNYEKLHSHYDQLKKDADQLYEELEESLKHSDN